MILSAIRRRSDVAVWAVAIVLALLVPEIFPSKAALTKMCLIGIAIIFALSYNVLLGQVGLLSFGHAVYFGISGFAAIHLINLIGVEQLPIPVFLVPLYAGVVGGIFGLLFGVLSTKSHGTAFAMISLAIAELVAASSLVLESFFGGESGVTTDRTVGPVIFGIDLISQQQVYYLIVAWGFVAAFGMYAFTRTPLGRMALAIRDNPERAEFVGYNKRTIRLLAFIVSAFFAGIAGGLAAINYEIMTAANLATAASGSVLIMTYIGGVAYFYGPVIGAIVISLIQLSLSDITPAWLLYLGVLFIITVLFAPTGIAGLIEMHIPALRGGVLHRLIPSYIVSGAACALLAIGGISLLEINYHVTLNAQEGPILKLFGLSVDTTQPMVWGAAIAITIVGFLLFRRTWPLVKRSWDDINARLDGIKP
ncbi:MAG: branched-chain amino acid ABC transporter permease [Afipia sp.]|nr:branched-chain amino acid ABC transporter permease [Afipia sp.]